MKTFPYLCDGNLTLVPMDIRHIELVRKWRNANRQWFFDSREVEAEEQLFWFHSIYQNDPTDQMWIAHLEARPVGTGALTHIDLDKREAEWSRLIIGEDFARGKGLAGRIARLVRDYGLDTLRLNRIYGSLYTHNQVTMHVDMAAGYLPYKVDGDITHVELWRKDHRP